VSGPSALTTDQGQPIALDQPDAFLYHLTAEPDDIDALGHVNNAVYVKWMERAAYAHSCAVGYDGAAYDRLGTTFVVRRHEIDYLAPAFAGDRIVDVTWPCEMERFTALRKHQIVRLSDGQILARALTTWIYLDANSGRPRRMSPEIIAAFRPRAGDAR
jgi:acyl-CoA thioester hydrolase